MSSALPIQYGPYAHASNYTKGRFRDIEFIVVHYTANDGDTDTGNIVYFKGEHRKASAHYFVDEDSITQSVRDIDTAWHCGSDKGYYHKKCRNCNSLGIEMCSDKNDKGQYIITAETVDLTVRLVQKKMEEYDIPIENVLRHYDVTHKACPEPWVRNPILWDYFKARLIKEDEMDQKTFNLMYAAMIAEKHGDKPSAWAKESCKKAQAKGVFNGDGENNYDWQEPLTREATAIILDNLGMLD